MSDVNVAAFKQNLLNSVDTDKFRYKTILIEIPAFCEFQLVSTVRSAIAQADVPERLHFVVCYQNDDKTDYDILKYIPNMNLIFVPTIEARGLCYARYLCQQELKDEDYVLHIDSHMRFVKHWDTMMIEQLENIDDDKAILSTYLAPLSADMLKLELTDSFFDKPSIGYTMTVMDYNKTFYQFSFSGRDINRQFDTLPKRNVWVSGHYIFARSDYDRNVEADPYNYFYQDELSIAVRTFTHGYNVYCPEELYIYHQYNRDDRKMPSNKNPDIEQIREDEKLRVQTLLRLIEPGVDLGKYGLGSVRTIDEFEKLSGVDFRNHIIKAKANVGLYYEIDSDVVLPKHELNYLGLDVELKKTIHVLMVGLDIASIKQCIKNLEETVSDKLLLKFHIVVGAAHYDKDELNEYDVIYVDKSYGYGGYLSVIDYTKIDDDDYVMVIDSNMRFNKEYQEVCWNEYYVRQCLRFGENAVLGCKVDENCDDDVKIKYNGYLIPNGFYGYILTYNTYNFRSADEYEQVQLLRDGFMFTKAYVVKNVPFDKHLSLREHMLTYSARLYTHGYDIYYGPYSYCHRKNTLEDVCHLNDDIRNNYPEQVSIISYLFSLPITCLKLLPKNFDCKLGNKRRLEVWFKNIKVDYLHRKLL